VAGLTKVLVVNAGSTSLKLTLVDDTGDEIPIPGQDFGFGRLIRAQAEGDFRSLSDLGRKIVRVRI